MRKKWIMIAVALALLLVGGVLVGPIMSDVEHPPYTTLATQENIEIRRYEPRILAEVEVEGDRDKAINEGFELLADFIFGNNTAQQNISMTAPVQQQASQKIAMTAPVQQQASGDAWKVSFIMPSEFTMETLPRPNNDRVTITQLPARKYAVIRFSGTNGDDNIARHQTQLMDYVRNTQLQQLAAPINAFYNPPWTLPPLRRNEVMVEIR